MKREKDITIMVLLGTVRDGRKSEQVAKFVYETVNFFEGVHCIRIDIRKDLRFSQKDEGPSMKKRNKKWKKAVEDTDGIFIVSPEYNHGYPGSLKYALDMLFDEYKHKAVAVCGVSSGRFAGARMIELLMPIVRDIGLCPISIDLNIGNVQEIVGEDGTITDERILKRARAVTKELIWMAKTLKYGRENII